MTDSTFNSAPRWDMPRGFAELDTPPAALALSDTTFCVIDLETTGGSPDSGSKITEIGAVKVRGGACLGEFHTLINP
ncbi:MAG: exonuclease domain-containing protein, partial [Nocardioides sp.]